MLNPAFHNHYETVAASQTDQALGPTGAKGDFLERLVVTVGAAATSTVSIKDGAGASIPLLPANTPIGVYTVWLGIKSTAGAWSVSTGAGATAVAVGYFS